MELAVHLQDLDNLKLINLVKFYYDGLASFFFCFSGFKKIMLDSKAVKKSGQKTIS